MTRSDELAYEAYEAEFAALRTEIIERIKWRHQLLLASLGIAGAIMSFALSIPPGIPREALRLRALYLVAPVTSLMGGFWVSNNWGMYRIRFYIVEVLAPRMNAILSKADREHTAVLGWETSAQRQAKGPFLRELEQLFYFLTFVLTGALAQSLLLLDGSGSILNRVREVEWLGFFIANWVLLSCAAAMPVASAIIRRRQDVMYVKGRI